MTPNEKTIQELRRENERLSEMNRSLEKTHQEDLAESLRLRRMFEAHAGGGMLSGLKILEEVRAGRIEITDFDRRRLNPNSYNIRLHNELLVYDTDRINPETGNMQHTSHGPLDMKKMNPHHVIKIPEQGLLLQPNRLYLGQTMERTRTDFYVPAIDGRSSVGRLGIEIHVTAGFGDIGFSGWWTFEITCVQPVMIYPHVEIGQIYFQTIVGDFNKYDSKKYQNNRGVQPSLMYRDFEEGR